MNRKAFLLGLLSIGGQVLLLRELVASFNGDELFIGTALFGWLVSVALGAWLGGKVKLPRRADYLFIIGLVLLPILILAVRLLPLAITGIMGEIVPFLRAAACSIVSMIPIGIISGWLFTSITGEGHRPALSIVVVYFYEGLGAFVGGLLTTALVGPVFSSFGMALALAIIVLAAMSCPAKMKSVAVTAGLSVAALVATIYLGPVIDYEVDKFKYRPYRLETSFDTHYGRQTIISREKSLVLMTDNIIEAIKPDPQTSENLFLPPLLFMPEADNILYIGRPELGVADLTGHFPRVTVTALDPRRMLTEQLTRLLPSPTTVSLINDDPISFLTERRALPMYDIIILDAGEPNNYKTGRLLTTHCFHLVAAALKPGGIFFLPVFYDTDRYISPEKKQVLAVIYNTLTETFKHVSYWPGEMTLFFASDRDLSTLTPDTLIARTAALPCDAQYINDIYLSDRLNDLKLSRLGAALATDTRHNSLEHPLLPHYQAILNSQTSPLERTVVPPLLGQPWWLLALPVLIVALFFRCTLDPRRRRAYGLFLLFTAGLVSLALELTAFYVYQSYCGSLYSELAALIGAFMFGLALGTYYSYHVEKENLEFPALLLLLTAGLMFLLTYDNIPMMVQFYYYLLFLFTAAVGTGSLFVAATDRYYFGRAGANRGLGYAVELVGSSLGALLTITVILPSLGLLWLMISTLLLLVLALVGAVISLR